MSKLKLHGQHCELSHIQLWCARVSQKYIHFVLMYMTDNIGSVLQIKHLVNKDGESTTPQKLATGTEPSVSNIRV